jgi:hypothetical protein
MSIQPIETEYGGTVYRSRMEARWAVLFDYAGIGFQYEPEAYKLESGRYVPDFWLRGRDCFFEVKPDDVIIAAGYYCRERSLAEDLAYGTGKDVMFGCGNPHVLLQLSVVLADGIPPEHMWLTDFINPHWVARAMQYRFEWKRANRAVAQTAVDMIGIAARKLTDAPDAGPPPIIRKMPEVPRVADPQRSEGAAE